MTASRTISVSYRLLAVVELFAVFAAIAVPAQAQNINNNVNNSNNVNTNTNTVNINSPAYQPMPYYPPQPYPYPYPQPQPLSNCFDGIDNDGIEGVDQADYGCQGGRDNEFINRPYVVPSAPTPVPQVLGARYVYVSMPAPAQTYVQTAAVGCALRIYDLGVYNDAEQNAIVRFSTTCPASGHVRYGLASEWEKTGGFAYPFTSQSTGGVTGFATTHQINLGKLPMNQTHFLRAFATSGNVTAFSVELAFVQLPTGVQVMGGGNSTPTTSASVYSTFGGFLFNPWFLFFIILALVVAIVMALRRRDVVSTTGPIEINA